MYHVMLDIPGQAVGKSVGIDCFSCQVFGFKDHVVLDGRLKTDYLVLDRWTISNTRTLDYPAKQG